MENHLYFFVLYSIFLFSFPVASLAEGSTIKVGVATPLTGDAAVIGDNLQKTAETYRKRYLRYPIEFVFEDAKKGSVDGLRAYQALINGAHVDVLVGGTTSNGTIAGAPLVNSSRTPLITPLTGGSNIDNAGEYIFRIGNSDVLNGYQQADWFLEADLKRAALFTEQTEYTQDIAKFFRERFKAGGGDLLFDEDFLPDKPDFRSEITKLRSKNPQALFISTQTGVAFGIFVKQWRQLGGKEAVDIYTNFLAASNPDAFEAAGDAIYGVRYMAPSYDSGNPALVRLFKEFREDHNAEPSIGFHTAGMVDALNMLQDFLDSSGGKYDRVSFHDYLLRTVKNYKGLMGTYSFDAKGNADIGFSRAEIKKSSG